ncbi:SIT4 phosphatase-associated protein-domain-containing protein [Polychytrium aggregatum]|uniref:SIT4 phosphatase-associated protein-domain-containing protein n=1 Tax=Polychytrium aggregatum TaxID=110093 RepID=UPI0022FF35F1|nr:SIT4 phosphatase-associated protein-domain-containing protein [Polychytrium aggregatum]KAI9205622.1 SIT4 phosphatase-associated protein-domain-containing protein [Polychytrium aggregatum]
MFWRFGFHNAASAIDTLLEKEGVTLDELMEEEELLQECKAHNTKLIDFLCKPESLTKLLGYIVDNNLDETKAFKYPYLASEIVSCEIFSICEGIMSNISLLNHFWSILEGPVGINPLQASYFCKVNGVLLQKKTAEFIQFVRSVPNFVTNILRHIGSSAIADLLLKLISAAELPEGNGIVEWLNAQGLIAHLVSRLDPNLDPEMHNTAAQTLLDIIAVSYQSNIADPTGGGDAMPQSDFLGNSLVNELKSKEIVLVLVTYMLDTAAPNTSSSLTNGINIFIELIRRYCSDIEQAEYQQHQMQLQQQNQQQLSTTEPSPARIRMLAIDLSDMLSVLRERLTDFAKLLDHQWTSSLPTVRASAQRLGPERLKTCELFAEILHLQYLYTSSPLFERLTESGSLNPAGYPGLSPTAGLVNGVDPMQVCDQTIVDELIRITEIFSTFNILPTCLNLFFQHEWNNFLHSVVYDMIAKVFNTYSFTSSLSAQRAAIIQGTDAPPADFVPNPAFDAKIERVQTTVRRAVVSILRDGALTKRITEAQRRNDAGEEQPKGVRLGYMGHLTYISDEVSKLLEKCGPELMDDIKDTIASSDWQDYVNGILKDTKERDRQPLGGVRPASNPSAMPPMSGAFDDADTGVIINRNAPSYAMSGITGLSDDEDDDIDGVANRDHRYSGEGEASNDQFARYLCQQIVNDLPDRLLGAESSDDEEDEQGWIDDLDNKNSAISPTFQISGHLAVETRVPGARQEGGDSGEFDDDDDDDDDDEDEQPATEEHPDATRLSKISSVSGGDSGEEWIERPIEDARGNAPSITYSGPDASGAKVSSPPPPARPPVSTGWADFSSFEAQSSIHK